MRGNHRVIAALLTIERENAEADLENITVDPVAISRERRAIRAKGRNPSRRSTTPKLRRPAPPPAARRQVSVARPRTPRSQSSRNSRKSVDSDGDGAAPNLTQADLADCTGSATDDGCYTDVVFYQGKPFAKLEGYTSDTFTHQTIPVAEWRDGRRLLARLGKLHDYSAGHDGDDDSALYKIVAVIWGGNHNAIAS